MVCTYFEERSVEKRQVAMSKAGWSDEKIAQLEAEVELAKRKAEAASYAAGDTRSAQQRKIAAAEKAALRVAHDREHAELVDMAKDIEKMRAFKGAHPGHHYDEDAMALTDKTLAGISYSHDKEKAS